MGKEKLIKAAQEAYDAGDPIIPDDTFDALESELDGDYKDKHILGYVSKDREKVEHTRPMGSLLKLKSAEEVIEWLSSRPGHLVQISPKYDGSSVELLIKDAKLVRAITRGNGKVGLDCTKKLQKSFSGLNINDSGSETISDRVEVVITNKDWKKLQKKYPELYHAQRNTAAGILNSLYDTKREDLYKYLTIKPFYDAKAAANPRIKKETIELVVKKEHLTADIFTILKDCKEIWDSKFLTDGIVLTDLTETVTYDSKMFPSNQIAVKFEGESKVFTVDEIIWDVSRHGRLAPVLKFTKAKELTGAKVQKATAFNYEYVFDNEIGKGAQVEIVRSGDIIPHVVRVLKKALPGERIDLAVCPVCSGTNLQKKGVHMYCMDDDCEGKVIKQISWYLKSMGVENFAEKEIDNLISECVMEGSISSLYRIKYEELIKLPGWEEKKAKKFMKAIDSTKRTTEIKLLTAIGIEGIGEEIWRSILSYYGLSDLLSGIVRNTDLMQIDGISDERANTILNGINDNYLLLTKLTTILKVKREIFAVSDKFKDMAFCITGSLDTWERPEIEKALKQLGAKISKTRFDILVTNFPNTPTAKLKRAKEIGAKVINEEQLIVMLDEEKD